MILRCQPGGLHPEAPLVPHSHVGRTLVSAALDLGPLEQAVDSKFKTKTKRVSLPHEQPWRFLAHLSAPTATYHFPLSLRAASMMTNPSPRSQPNRDDQSPVCRICQQPVPIENAKTDGNGDAVHEACYVFMVRSDRAAKSNRLPGKA